ncbi:type II toxin-antitoxin system RelE/ParE family toxin [Candidatus Daviesbacteria bacterium]|nr:type II toxin-antitoxin system RelE/ParE family toxin [Candidatus Daviesbacteria bacterium]
MAWKVLFFQTARGDYPVKKFIEEQDLATSAKIASSIELLETDGPYLKPPYIKKLQDKLYELRVSGKVAVRIFYTIKDGEYYLLHAFKKKSQKTPSQEIKTAHDRMMEVIALL